MLIEIPDEWIPRIEEELDRLPITHFPMLLRLWPLLKKVPQEKGPEPHYEITLRGNILTYDYSDGHGGVGRHGKKVQVESLELNHFKLMSPSWVGYFKVLDADYSTDVPTYKLEEVID